jgi:glycosyltransferase involved in cell wall biosynthesis
LKIAVNTRLLLPDKLEGIGRFTNELMFRIVAAHPECEFHFLFDRPFDPEFTRYENIIAHVVRPPLRHALLGWIWFDWSVKRVLKKIKPDVFFSPDSMNLLSPVCKNITVIHDLNFEHFPEYLDYFLRLYYQKRIPEVARNASALVSVSEFSARDISEQYGIDASKIHVVYNAVGKEFVPSSEAENVRIREELTGGKEFFVFVGALYKRKNLVNQLRAFELFKESSGSDMKFLIAGNRVKDADELVEVVEKSSYKDDIILYGRISEAQLPVVLSAAKALTYVSIFEGFGMPILEAMSCGTPVITSNTSGMPEVAGDAALYADPFMVDEIKKCMQDISSNQELRDRLSKNAMQQVKKFDWDKSSEQLWQLLSSVAKQ